MSAQPDGIAFALRRCFQNTFGQLGAAKIRLMIGLE